MAARLWPAQEAIGKRLRLARPNSPWLTVVGIVEDVRDFGDWRETWYLPYVQNASAFGANTLHLMLRSSLPADVLGDSVRTVVRSIDSELPVPIPTPMATMWTAGLEQQQLAASASSLFGFVGVVLAAIGTYGVLAYAVSARAREFGIRLALGAARQQLVVDVVRRGVILAIAGLAPGIAAGMVVNRALAVVAPESPGTPIHTAAALLAVLALSATAASLIPAVRATRVDPADVMRAE
jgi:ABC-type antimicrobial peptide transport system permease subunit